MKRILIIDDEHLQARFYEMYLKRRGYDVVRINSVDQAFDSIARLAPDIVLLDIMMPPGKLYKDVDHFMGLRTGLFLAEDILRKFPTLVLFIITNVKNPTTRRLLVSIISEDRILDKYDCPPDVLADRVAEFLGEDVSTTTD